MIHYRDDVGIMWPSAMLVEEQHAVSRFQSACRSQERMTRTESVTVCATIILVIMQRILFLIYIKYFWNDLIMYF